MQATALKTRRTQAERSSATRVKLLDATLDCLCHLGYARTTTPEIARRAGLSRGAQLHHFPTKAELVTSAVEHLFERRNEEFLRAFARVPAGTDRAAAAIDILWSMVSGPIGAAWLELTIAARTDPELRQRCRSTTQRLSETIERTFRELFAAPGTANPFYENAPRFVFALLEGLALNRIHTGDDPETPRILESLKALARLVMPADT